MMSQCTGEKWYSARAGRTPVYLGHINTKPRASDDGISSGQQH